jgi:molecular chaperone HtpG
MTADEIRTYINQIAFSGAMDFVEKYKEKGAETPVSSTFRPWFLLGLHGRGPGPHRYAVFPAGAEAASWQSEDGMSYDGPI